MLCILIFRELSLHQKLNILYSLINMGNFIKVYKILGHKLTSNLLNLQNLGPSIHDLKFLASPA